MNILITKNLVINNIYIDKFWHNINNKYWIYVDDVIILGCLLVLIILILVNKN